MKISTLGRHFREGGKNVIRNGWMTFASISSISISLLILGLFLVLSLNVQFLSEQVEKQVEIRVFLDVHTSDETITALKDGLTAMSEVEKVTFITKEEGLEWMRERLGKDADSYLEGFDGEDNPLNDSFTVEVIEPRQVADTAGKINEMNATVADGSIIKISYGQGTVEHLFKATKVINNIGLVFVACLGLTAMFLISNTIKLTIMARNREIKIMKLVGATNGFIRWPFFIEGALLGFLGALVPVGILAYGYYTLLHSNQVDMSVFMMQFKPFEEVVYPVCGLLLAIGVVIGIWGSTLSVRKFLKV